MTLPISAICDPCDHIAVGLGLGERRRRRAAAADPAPIAERGEACA